MLADFFETHPQVYWGWFAQEDAREGIAPNAVHKLLVELERRGSPSTAVTQNIGRFHQSAGPERIFELYGNWSRLPCVGCGRRFSIADFDEARTGAVSRCPSCVYVARSDIVFYEEMLSSGALGGAVRAVADADMLIIAETNLVVYPAAGLVDYYDGDRLVLMNATLAPYDSRANLVIHDSMGEVFAELTRAV